MKSLSLRLVGVAVRRLAVAALDGGAARRPGRVERRVVRIGHGTTVIGWQTPAAA